LGRQKKTWQERKKNYIWKKRLILFTEHFFLKYRPLVWLWSGGGGEFGCLENDCEVRLRKTMNTRLGNVSFKKAGVFLQLQLSVTMV
jgi:hypothetical protein